MSTHPPLPRGAVFGWVLFDWSAQPVYTLVTTFVFAPYFASAIATTPAEGQAQWGFATALAGLVVAILSPFLGAIADASRRRKPWIAVFGVMIVAGSWSLWFGKPGQPDTAMIVLIAYIVMIIGTEFATVFNNAMMPSLVPPERMGRLSGLGWAIGYLGGMTSLVITLGLLAASPQTGKTLLGLTPLFGLDPLMREGDRAAGPLTAIWFIVFVLPMFLLTPDMPKRMAFSKAVNVGMQELAETWREMRKYRNIMTFLVANMIYADGLIALFTFGGIYGAGVFGWSVIELGIFGIFLTITGTIGALIGGRIDDAIGSKPVVMGALLILFLTCLATLSIDTSHVFFVIETAPKAPGAGLFGSTAEKIYVLVGLIMGLGAGTAQAASRSLLVHIAPEERIGQFFGLFALSGKATSFAGPLLVGLVTTITASQRLGVAVILLFFAVGGFLLLQVSVPKNAE